MRYFFDASCTHGLSEDREGEHFSSPAAAHSEAVKVLRQLAGEDLKFDRTVSVTSILIRDETGSRLGTAHVRDALITAIPSSDAV